jgi:hypothetical protein
MTSRVQNIVNRLATLPTTIGNVVKSDVMKVAGPIFFGMVVKGVTSSEVASLFAAAAVGTGVLAIRLYARCQVLSARLESTHNLAAEAVKQNLQLRSANKLLIEELDDAEAARQEAVGKTVVLQGQNTELSSALSDVTAERDASATENGHLKGKNEELTQELKSVRGALLSAEDDLEAAEAYCEQAEPKIVALETENQETVKTYAHLLGEAQRTNEAMAKALDQARAAAAPSAPPAPEVELQQQLQVAQQRIQLQAPVQQRIEIRIEPLQPVQSDASPGTPASLNLTDELAYQEAQLFAPE